jgi:hypothetical protein
LSALALAGLTSLAHGAICLARLSGLTSLAGLSGTASGLLRAGRLARVGLIITGAVGLRTILIALVFVAIGVVAALLGALLIRTLLFIAILGAGSAGGAAFLRGAGAGRSRRAAVAAELIGLAWRQELLKLLQVLGVLLDHALGEFFHLGILRLLRGELPKLNFLLVP